MKTQTEIKTNEAAPNRTDVSKKMNAYDFMINKLIGLDCTLRVTLYFNKHVLASRGERCRIMDVQSYVPLRLIVTFTDGVRRLAVDPVQLDVE